MGGIFKDSAIQQTASDLRTIGMELTHDFQGSTAEKAQTWRLKVLMFWQNYLLAVVMSMGRKGREILRMRAPNRTVKQAFETCQPFNKRKMSVLC